MLSPAPCPRAQLSGDVGLSWEPVELIVVGGGQLASHQMTSTVTF